MNPHETLRRQQKARAIARTIFRTLTPEERVSDALPKAVARMEPEARAAWAQHADQNAPSAATWEVVVEVLQGMVADERAKPPCGAPRHGPHRTTYCLLGEGHDGAHDDGRMVWSDNLTRRAS